MEIHIILGYLAVVVPPLVGTVDPWLCVPAFWRVFQFLMIGIDQFNAVHVTTATKTHVKGLWVDIAI